MGYERTCSANGGLLFDLANLSYGFPTFIGVPDGAWLGIENGVPQNGHEKGVDRGSNLFRPVKIGYLGGYSKDMPAIRHRVVRY